MDQQKRYTEKRQMHLDGQVPAGENGVDEYSLEVLCCWLGEFGVVVGGGSWLFGISILRSPFDTHLGTRTDDKMMARSFILSIRIFSTFSLLMNMIRIRASLLH